MFIEMNIVYLYCTIVLTKHLIFAEFICNNNAQCNGHGDCNDEQCDCDSDWSSQVDCSGNISSPSFNMYVIRGHSMTMWSKRDEYVAQNFKNLLAQTLI